MALLARRDRAWPKGAERAGLPAPTTRRANSPYSLATKVSVIAAGGPEPGFRAVAHLEHGERGDLRRTGPEPATPAALLDDAAYLGRVPVTLGHDGEAIAGVEAAHLGVADGHLSRETQEVQHEGFGCPAQLLGHVLDAVQRLFQGGERSVHRLVHDRVQDLLLGGDVVVQARGPDPEGLGDVLHRGAVIAAIGEKQAGRVEHGARAGDG